MTERQWHTAQVYYYDEDKRNLLLDCIQPLLQTASMVTERYFFLTHWLRGPHLRLYFYCTDAQFSEHIKPLIATDVEAYLRVHPSQTHLREEDVRHHHEYRAKLEMVSDPLFPLFPDNSIQYIEHDSLNYQKRSTTDLLSYQILEDFYIDTNSLVFAMLEQARQGKSILTQAFDLLVTTGHLMGRHIVKTCDLYRSQAEACIRSSANPQAMQALFDKQYQAQEKMLNEHLSQLLDALDFQEDTFLFTQEWDQIQQVYWKRLRMIALYGTEVDPAEVDDQQMDVFNRIQKNFDYDQWYQCYEPLAMLQHLHLERLGISPIKRFLLCYFIAKTTEQVFQLNVAQGV